MSNDPRSTAATPRERTDVRFSMRALLIWMVVVAVVAAALGPYFRSIPPEARQSVFTVWGICILFALTILVVDARSRFRLERTAGALRLQFQRASRRLAAPAAWYAYVGGALCLGLGLFYPLVAAAVIERRSSIVGLLYAYLFFGVICGRFIALGMTMIWWGRAVQLRDEGVLLGLRLLRWTHVIDCHWSRWTRVLSLEGLDQQHREASFDAFVPVDEYDAVHQVLAEKAPRLLASPSSLEHAAIITASPQRFRKPSRREMAKRFCLMFIVIFVAATVVPIQLRFVQAVEFRYSLIAGLITGVAINVFSWRQQHAAGPPRIRLSIRFDWWRLLTWLAFVVLLCWIGAWLAPWSGLIGAGTGFGCGFAFYAAIRLIGPIAIHLCENGIVVPQQLYWPWQTTTACWSGDHLTFRRGWRRIATNVPPHERDAVEALLKEKLIDDRTAEQTKAT